MEDDFPTMECWVTSLSLYPGARASNKTTRVSLVKSRTASPTARDNIVFADSSIKYHGFTDRNADDVMPPLIHGDGVDLGPRLMYHHL